MDNKNKTIDQFINELASDMPAPGGGGAAALVGAIGVSLGNMVASLSIGKEKFKYVEDELKECSEKALKIKDELLQLIDDDAKGFLPLLEAYKLPASTDAEKESRANEIERCSFEAIKAPLAIMHKCAEAINIVAVFAEKGSKMAASDAACAAALLKAAMVSASLNVFVNTKYLKDRSRAEEINASTDEILDKYCEYADSIYSVVLSYIK